MSLEREINPFYIAPEQACNRAVNIGSDLYITGIFLYQLFMGVPPYRGKPLAVLEQHMTAHLPSLCKESEDIPDFVEQFFLRLMGKKSEDRFVSPQQAMTELAIVEQKINERDGETNNSDLANELTIIEDTAIREVAGDISENLTMLEDSGNSGQITPTYAAYSKASESKTPRAETASKSERRISFTISSPEKNNPQKSTPEICLNEIVLDKYKIIKELGRGGMGIVYKIEHTLLQNNKYFALKTMHPFLAANEESYKRFLREVEATMSLTHRNIISIRDFGLLPNKTPYLTMDYSEGSDLQAVLKDNWEYDINRTLTIVYQILQGLEEAHSKNIIHRDLKPANILVEKEKDGSDLVKIVDFGLAKLLDGEMEAITQTTIGTPNYMAPEQISGKEVDHRVDIYAIGVILYYMLSGKMPFPQEKIAKLFAQKMYKDPIPLTERTSHVDEVLVNMVHKAIERESSARYSDISEILTEIEEYLDSKGVLVKKSRPVTQPIQMVQREEREKETPKTHTPIFDEPSQLSVEKQSVSSIYERKPTEPIPVQSKEQAVTTEKPDIEKLEMEEKPETEGATDEVDDSKPLTTKKSFRREIIIVVVCCFIGLLVIIFKDVFSPPKQTQENEEKQPITSSPVKFKRNGWFGEKMPRGMIKNEIEGEYLWYNDRSVMVYVPEGPFYRGSSRGKASERPIRKITLSSYYIDRCELTNKQYDRFVVATGHRKSPYASNKSYNHPRNPVVGISWYDAERYAKWAHKKLPTEAQWEKAARGGFKIPDWQLGEPQTKLRSNKYPQRIFPWKTNKLHSGLARYMYKGKKKSKKDPKTVAVDLYPQGVSPYGCLNMAGNVWEWCNDWYLDSYYKKGTAKNPRGPKKSSNKKTCRGGSWETKGKNLVTYRRLYYPPNKLLSNVGVRFVKEVNGD